MNTTINTLSSAESFPKRLRSASARLFSVNTTPIKINKRSSCYFHTENTLKSSPSNTSYSVFNPSTWFPRIRQKSTSSSSSSFTIVYTPTTSENFLTNDYTSPNSCSFENMSKELQSLFENVEIEISFAVESHGSIYYEGDYSTAHSAFSVCLAKYESALQFFGDTTNTIKFAFRWESSINQLRLRLNALPEVTNSIYN